MLRPIQQLSAFFFYLLGASLFLAYVLMHNGIAANAAAWWLQVADLPLLFSACVYGGLSLYLSVKSKDSTVLRYLIAVPISLFFVWMVAWNFANLWWH